MSEIEYRKLKQIYIKDIGWQKVSTEGNVFEIKEHPVNGWVTVGKRYGAEWLVNPRWIIVKEYI